MKTGKLRSTAFSIGLVVLSTLISLIFIEMFLRFFYPRYEYAAESNFERDTNRLWSRRINSHQLFKHPDTGAPHLVYHNNLGLRQSRDIDLRNFSEAVNIAFFGDSFTENLRIASQYVFTEPLDYLLNENKINFNTLNFGVDGYGTDQAYLYYSEFEYSKDLDYVFYNFCVNDLRNIYENNIFNLNKDGVLIQNEARKSPWWIKFLSTLHTTYLIIDIRQILAAKTRKIDKRAIEERFAKLDQQKRFGSPRAYGIQRAFMEGEMTEDLSKSINILKKLLHTWRSEVEKNGGKFYIVLLPRPEENLANELFRNEFDVISLYNKFSNSISNYDYSDIRFESDGHWNELGNQLAAVKLYRFLEKDVDLTPISEDEMKNRLYTYYRSFDDWMAPNSTPSDTAISNDVMKKVRVKYNELEIEYSGR